MTEIELRNTMSDRGTQNGYFENEEAGVDFTAHLKALMGIVRRNAVLIGCIVAAIVMGGIVVTMLMTPTYKATSQILIEDQADEIIENSDLQKTASSLDTDRFLQTQLGIIRSRALAISVVQGGRLDHDPAFFESLGGDMPSDTTAPGQKLDGIRQDLAVKLLLNALVVDMPTDSRIAAITITTRSPTVSANLANMYAERYIENNLNRKFESSSYARKFLANQLDETRNKLTQSERDLNQYARAAGLIRVSSNDAGGGQDAALSITNNKLVQLNNSAATATADRIAAEDRWNAISGQPPLTISEVNTNAAITQLVSDKIKAESQLADELSKHQEGYSTVKAKRAEIGELDKRIINFANSLKKSAQIEYQTAVSKEKSLNSQVNSLRSDAMKEQDRSVQYSVLKRVADTSRALYESLLSRYNQLNATAGSASNNVSVVDRADIPHDPSSPKLALNVALSLVLGLVCAACAVALKEVLDDAIRSPNDVETKLGLPLLGLIPLGKQSNIDDDLRDRRSSAVEAYRSLVTNLRYSTSTGLPKVLAITSARESEGKSTTARAIATDIAMLGQNVLIVDTDLRRPTLHHTMQDKAQSGLTDVLIGQKTFDEVVRQSPSVPTLSYITGLPTPPDPALILAGEGLTSFIALARSRFDTVVLDCPPLLGLSDVPLLAGHADGLLFVIDASSFHRGAVKSALRRLSLINANVLGVVLNRFTPKSGGDDYDYYSYNYYSYGSKSE